MRNKKDEIKNRKIELALSLKVCHYVKRYCGKCGVTLNQLLESFVGDLVNGTYTNGSDERMLANYWLENISNKVSKKGTLLYYLFLEEKFDYFVELMEDIEYTKNDLAKERECPEPDWEYIEDYSEVLLRIQEEYEDIISDFLKKNPCANIKQEISDCMKWKAWRNRFANID